MYGIVAVFDSGSSVDDTDVIDCLEPMTYRGPDGCRTVVTDEVGLGHQHFYVTPEAGDPEQPLVYDGVYVALDGRIDNREDLLRQLPDDVVPGDGNLTDAQIVAAAYREWGESFVDQLLGAFAVVVWDADRERLVCVRDRTGIRHLYYAVVDGLVVVGSEIRAVLAHPSISATVNEGMVAEYLAGDITSQQETFYTNVRRLKPGTRLIAAEDGTNVERYWRLTGEPTLVDVDHSNLAAELRRVLRTAVRCRLRGRRSPGTMMSGGLDSTTVASLGHRLLTGRGDGPMETYSLVYDETPAVDESDRMHAVESATGINSTYVSGDPHWPLRNPDAYRHSLPNGPVAPVQLAMNNVLFERASAGHDALLTGIGGDVMNGTRLTYLDTLSNGRLLAFLNDVFRDDHPTRRVLFWDVLLPVYPNLATWFLDDDPAIDWQSWLDDTFVERVDLRGRWSRSNDLLAISERGFEHLLESMFGPMMDFDREATRLAALRHGLDLRHPFLDARVVELAASIPPRQRFRAGERKHLLRRATTNLLPRRIRTQMPSSNYGPFVDKGLCEREADRVHQLLSDPTLADRGYVDRTAVRRAVEQYLDSGGWSLQIWRLLSAELWLREVVTEASEESHTVS